MVKLKSLPNPPQAALQKAGWDWALGTDTAPYVVNDMVIVTEQQAGSYYEAAGTLYDMLIEAGQHAIDHNLFREMGIPENLVELIKLSWSDDRQIHLYGRFDLAGGFNDEPVKLIEFNADTATCVPETAVVQWAHLRMNGMDESRQFNTLFETLVGQFAYLKAENGDLTPSMLFSAMRGYPEDDTNVAVLMEAAKEAGFDVEFAYIDDVEFSNGEGIFYQEPEHGHFVRFDFWFKLVPWEHIGADEPELAAMLTEIVKNRKAVVLNPAYTLLFQSKYILKILWDLYPYHPLLLQTERDVLPHKKSVSKVLLGREGANVVIHDESGAVLETAAGEYDDQPRIYQEYVALPTDEGGYTYQAGVFYAGEACALGFRRGGKILDNTAQFVGHVVD
ncbi:glutathionylspermidine synthase [Dyadobacter sp. BE34]|uniref:Glutathionylspermidine synthase n=1 Tax=Dyadobacter fermentans TaxID=94254 RepID=A0ABU1R5M6_9BACT|nr:MULTISPECIES: glutathionylspermidine synthase family protein [Dyadobacter]MDR6808224.1 glutathionylspermidine synthase [Dyadobacter fermentans]MDR7045960.1 glutathionylspermidine synthase [Dyadobacter sp. BE242]MDR7200273.1 glutathionylspermidine synthase [Dyadobacter sp. BE34]MDR7218233.1 glutathionylspermidine synthase [Dyadobacter sp. BE31]MDR7266164.1 glutathionylspermidine synthase [Dyadobacter sp. BE32]